MKQRPILVRDKAVQKENERHRYYFGEGLRLAGYLPSQKRLLLAFRLNPIAYTMGTLAVLALAVLAVAVAVGVVTLS